MTKQTKTGLSFKVFDQLLMKNQDIKEEPGIYRSQKINWNAKIKQTFRTNLTYRITVTMNWKIWHQTNETELKREVIYR